MVTPLHRATLFVFSCAIALHVSAQPYPSKVVRLVIPSSPASGFDVIGRIVANGMSEPLGQQIVVENRAGANGTIGAEIAAKARPDGYTMMLGTTSHAVNAVLYRNLQFDLLRDFAPVTLLATLRTLAVTSARRMPLLPDYPTVAESGFPGFQFGSWYGFLVPAKTPPEAVATIHGAAMSALKNLAVEKRLTDLGYIIVAEGAEPFAAFLKSEIDSFGRVLKDLRGTLD